MLGRLRPHWRKDAGLPARIDALLAGDRRLGSRDRRLYRELIYTTLRYLPWIECLLDPEPSGAVRRIAWLAADTPTVGPFRAAVAGDLPPCPAATRDKARVLGADATALVPAWFIAECPGAAEPPLLDILQSRAPLWIRMQSSDPDAAFREFDRLGWAWRRSPLLPGAVALPLDADVSRTDAYRAGQIEIQDVGSQLVLELAGVEPGGHWLDACAGAGGKTLQLASMLGPSGRVTARDARPAALDELRTRASRAGLGERIAAGTRGDPPGGYDAVLVDAPCSGSGTWRRSPHLRWVTTEKAVRRAAALQLELLRENLPRVRPGGMLVYATCSLCRSENESVAGAFLEGSPGIEPARAGTRLSPESHDGDGYFLATFRRDRSAAS
jgi:16S rRNA (cytosine967-C5)-methyltransferase